MVKMAMIIFSAVLILSSQACQTQHTVEIEPVEIKPIHITIDVNVKIDEALNDYFGNIDEISE